MITDIRYIINEDRSSEDTDRGGAVENYEVEFDVQGEPRNRKFMARLGTGWTGSTKIPLMGQSHPFDPFIFVVNVDAAPMNLSGTVWKTTVIYESIQNPLEQLPTITYSGTGENVPIDRSQPAVAGDPVVPIANSSAELFDPPTTTTVSDGVITIVRNEETYDANLMDTFRDSINDAAWQGFALETVKLVSINAVKKEAQSGFFYFEVTYILHIRSDGWRKKIIDQGFRTINLDSSGNPTFDSDGAPEYNEIVDVKGKRVTQPVLLDGSGQKLPDGTEAVKLEFLINKRQDFDALGLPTI